MFGRRRSERIRPQRLRDPWRSLVREAEASRQRFEDARKRARHGPLRDRLADVGSRFDDGVRACWLAAQQGDALDYALLQVRPHDIEQRLAALSGPHVDAADASHPDRHAEVAALREELTSARRLQEQAGNTRDRLRRLTAELDEAVARAVELTVGGAGPVELQPVESAVDALVGELDALHQGLDEAGGAVAPPSS